MVSALPHESAQAELADHAPVEALVAGPLQAVDEVDHRAGRRVEQRDVGRSQFSARQRPDRKRVVFPVGHTVHRALMRRCVFQRREPDAFHVCTRLPRLGLGVTQSHHRPALRADEIVGGDAHRPAEPRGLADDLVEGVNGLRAADPVDRLHVLAPLEHLHAEGNGAELQQQRQIVDNGRPVVGHREFPRGTFPENLSQPPPRRHRVKHNAARAYQFNAERSEGPSPDQA